MSRYDQFADVYRNLDLLPLYTAEKIQRFRVPYAQRTLLELEEAVLAPVDNSKTIFTGHRGCGKSTLLAQLADRMREENLFVSGFSIARMVEMSDVNHINILYSMGIQLLDKAEELKVSIDENVKESLIQWFTQTKSKTYTEQLKQEFALGANLLSFFQGKLQKESSFREEIKETYERRVSDLSRHLDEIAGVIQKATGKEVLVIIDDLDKLELPVVKSIFHDHIQSLFSPNFRVVYTIPISVVREPWLTATLESERRTVVMLSVTKFFPKALAHEPDAEPIAANVKMLEAMLEKRIPDELIDADVKRQIVMMSGGVLREQVRLAQECCRECMLELRIDPNRSDLKIDADILKAAAKSLRNQFARTLGTQLYDLLKETYENFTPPDVKSDDFLELLHGLYVLEYENYELWYDLHPLVKDLLRQRGLIS